MPQNIDRGEVLSTILLISLWSCNEPWKLRAEKNQMAAFFYIFYKVRIFEDAKLSKNKVPNIQHIDKPDSLSTVFSRL